MLFSLKRKTPDEPDHGGSRPGRAANTDRDFEEGYRRIFQDYFADHPIYSSKLFRRRFRMHPELFLRIMNVVKAQDPCSNRKPMHLERRVSTRSRKWLLQFDYLPTDVHFYATVETDFGPKYLCSPTKEDLKRILTENASRGFPGMIGSIDCYNWKWKNCPKAWHGSYRGTSIVLEAAVSHDLWFWHAFFGMLDSMNDINVLQRSPLLHSIITDKMPSINYVVNESPYSMAYWLAHGIYLNWPVFMKSIPNLQVAARKHFTMVQEACRKDVKRAFGVL
uniref:DDE Tnp4 domain-containing protein n=1 Tax=Physcomitrium patens TaxID=3218 RepID=A0A2K1L6F2_PHYPA|nr:hypothetical protein PHYPA_000031 [Physcomitrium patens]